MSSKTHFVVLLLVAAVLAVVCQAQAETIAYREIFPNNTGNDLALSDADWNANRYDNRQYVIQSAPSGIGTAAGCPTDAQPINSYPSSTGLVKSYAFFSSDPTQSPTAVTWTEEVAGLDIQVGDVTAVSWYQGNSSASTAVSAALKVNDYWYVSADGFTSAAMGSGSSFVTDAELKTVDFTTATWNVLNFSSDLSRGAMISLPTTGVLQAAGMYFTSANNTNRFDTFEIRVIPEPGTLALLATGLIGLLCYAWRKRK